MEGKVCVHLSHFTGEEAGVHRDEVKVKITQLINQEADACLLIPCPKIFTAPQTPSAL